jgi:hypothetical protein
VRRNQNPEEESKWTEGRRDVRRVKCVIRITVNRDTRILRQGGVV